MLCLITYRRLAHGILLFHRYLLLYHPSVMPSLHVFLFNVRNRKYTQDLLHCTVHKISFPTSLYFPKLDSIQETYVRFTSAMKSLMKFQNAQHSMFLHNSLHGSSNSLVLDALECQLDRTSRYLIFFICTPLNKLSNWWRQQHPLRDLETLMIYLATLLGMTSFF
jgi:hypothetical protein